MSLAQTQPPAVEPVSLDEAKLHLRQFDTAEDSLIKLMIASARRYAEDHLGRVPVVVAARVARLWTTEGSDE